MILNTCSVKFYLEDAREKHDGFSIFCRIIANRKKAEFKIGFNCHPHEWDDKLGIPKAKGNDAHTKLAEINRIQSEVNSIVADANRRNKTLTPSEIKEFINGNGNENHTLLSVGHKLILKYEKTKQAPENLMKIKNTLEYVKQYLKEEKLTNIPIENVNLRFLKDFDSYLSNLRVGKYGQKLSINTIGKHMSRLKTVCKFAQDSELIDKNLFNGYRIPHVKVRKKSLTLEEFQRLRDIDLSGEPEKDRVRDAFIFCCYVGVRFADSQKLLKVENIQFNQNYNLCFLTIIQSKSEHNVGLPIYIPIIPEAMEIIKKYGNTNFRQIEGNLLPPISNQHANRVLKDLAAVTKIDNKTLTFHLSRHTCAQLQYEAEIPEKTTGAWLGHFSNSITSVYQNNYEKTLAKASIKFANYLRGNGSEE